MAAEAGAWWGCEAREIFRVLDYTKKKKESIARFF